ncbi:MAG: glycosyltransferase [Bacteroides sp.]|nr:glycosyltransferase [Bacteroides sp.]
MRKTEVDVSIIIINYNTKELTLNCINSLFEQTSGVTFEVILVDNASTDGSVELFSNDERICFVSSKENLGFGRANNLGYNIANGNFIFFIEFRYFIIE